MKILLLAQHYYPDMVSTGLHMTELTTKWKQLYPTENISVFTANSSRIEFDKDEKQYEIYNGVEVFRVSNWGKHHGNLFERLLFSIGFIFKAFFFILKKRNNFDLLLITTNPPFLGILILISRFFFKIPYVIIAYDIYPQILAKMGILKEKSLVYKFWKWLNIMVYNEASKIISIGEDMSKIITNDMKVKNLSKIELIHNWSDKTTVFPVEPNKNQFLIKNNLINKKILLYSGTLGSTHNIEDILEAAHDLAKNSNILFLFIGGGAKSILVSNYMEESGNNNVMFLPFQPIETISQSISSASLAFVCLDLAFTGLSVPSKSYGILAAGVPIIGLMDSSSEISIMIEKHKCGIVWNEHCQFKLSDLILKTIENDTELNQMKINAYDAFINNFEIKLSVTKYHNLVNNLNLN